MKTNLYIPPYQNIDTGIESNRRVLGLYYETIFKDTFLNRTGYNFKKSQDRFCCFDFYYRNKTKHIYLELKTRLLRDDDNVNYVDYEKLQKYKRIRDNTIDRDVIFYYVYNHITDFENPFDENKYYVLKINFDDFENNKYYRCVKQNKISFEIPIKYLTQIEQVFPKKYNEETKSDMIHIDKNMTELIKLHTIIKLENTKYETLDDNTKQQLFINHPLFQKHLIKKYSNILS
jgi:hypothetical protein